MVEIGGSKKRKLNKKSKLKENRGKFRNYDEIGKKFMIFVEIGVKYA